MRSKHHQFITALVLFSGIALIVAAYIYREAMIDHELESQLSLNRAYFDESYRNYKLLAENVYSIIVNDPVNRELFAKGSRAQGEEQALYRDRLQQNLSRYYGNLTEIGFRQLHYHLPNNHSFLRMHKPEKFGDDLSNVRYSVTKVNTTLQPVDGFENGRIFGGFRFVYPMFDSNGTHTGSVEASISTLAFATHVEEAYGADTHFLVRKSLVQTAMWKEELSNVFTEAIEHHDFYKEIEKHQMPIDAMHVPHEQLHAMEQEISEGIAQHKRFSIYAKKSNMILSFLPIHNIKNHEPAAYFVIYNKNRNIAHILFMFWVIITVILIFETLLLFMLKRDRNSWREIENINKNLERHIQTEIQKSQKRERQMMEQSRLAQMGEMISMIAHQWRQPLAAINAMLGNIRTTMELKYANTSQTETHKEVTEYLHGALDTIEGYVLGMSTTIDDFRNFYKPDKKLSLHTIDVPISKALTIINKSLEASDITLTCEFKSHKTLMIHDSELMQVFLNIIKNAQDHFNEQKMNNGSINIMTEDTKDGVLVTIIDNGNGIPEHVLPNIFDPYFSTKEEKNGTGLGLYMSKIIVEEHHNGKIRASNIISGAKFTIFIPDNLNKN